MGQNIDQGYTNSARGVSLNKGKRLANNVLVGGNDQEVKSEDVFGPVNAGQNSTKESEELDYVRNNLQALAMQSTYTPSQYQRILEILNEEEKYDEMVNMTGNLNDLDPVFSMCVSQFDVINAHNECEMREEKDNWIVDT